MIKPTKPRKPKKPKLQEPSRKVVDDFYLYYVDDSTFEDGNRVAKWHYELVKDDLVPMQKVDGEEYQDDSYSKAESVELSNLLKLLEDKNIEVKDVIIDNEVYYRKCNGQLVLKVSQCLSNKAYTDWGDKNKKLMDDYKSELKLHPDRLEEYKEQKKLWDIHQAELKLKKLKQGTL